jgi:Phage integrase family
VLEHPAWRLRVRHVSGSHGIDNIRNRVFDRAVERANKRLTEADKTPLPDGLTPHKLRHTFASLLVALGEDPGYVMDQIGHTNPNFTLRVYRHGMRRDEGEKERLRALVEGVDWAPMGTKGDSEGRGSEAEAGSGSEKPRDSGAFAEADDGTRTHDLLHGKQTL